MGAPFQSESTSCGAFATRYSRGCESSSCRPSRLLSELKSLILTWGMVGFARGQTGQISLGHTWQRELFQ